MAVDDAWARISGVCMSCAVDLPVRRAISSFRAAAEVDGPSMVVKK